MTGRSLGWLAGGIALLFLLCAGAIGSVFGGGGGSSAGFLCIPAPSTSAATAPGASAAPAASSPAASTQVVPAADGSYPKVGRFTPAQVANAATIIAVGKRLGVPARGWVVALATAIQESDLNNLDHGDRDSLGLFQQRPSQGWGTPAQLLNPDYAATAFYQRLLKVDHWQQMQITDAAQAVQRSAFPQAYARRVADANTLASALAGVTAGGGCVPAPSASAGALGWVVPVHAPIVSGFRTAHRPGHNGVDLGAARGTTIVAATTGTVTRVRCNVPAGHSCDVDGYVGLGGCGWYVDITSVGGVISRYCHMLTHPMVAIGQAVVAGQPIGVVGTSGNSSGPHLHFEIHLNGDASSAGAIEPTAWMREHGAPLGS